MAASTSDLIKKTGANTVTTLSAPGKALSATSITVGSTTNYPTDTGIIIAIRQVDSAGELVAGTYTEWSATVTSATTLAIVAVPVYGSDQVYPAGSTTQVYIPLSAYAHNKLIDGFTAEHSQLDGTHTDITADSIVVLGDVEAASFTLTGAGGDNGWSTGLPAPDTVTNNGNRSYDLVFNSNDLTDTVSEGMRLRLTRTVSAPTQCADLESGSSQYFSRASGSLTGISFTDDFTVMAWVKLESYAAMYIVSRYTSGSDDGWAFDVNASGQLGLYGAGASNRTMRAYQSLPLGKWVHVAASFNMSAGTGTIYQDGVVVPSLVSGVGTALTQSGDLNIGALSAASFFDGKIAQVGLFDAVLSDATVRSYQSQTLSGSETNCIGAWTLNGVLTDADTNANTLTANGGALATNVDSPFGSYLGGTLEYGIITKTAFSTNTTLTVQVPEGCAIPTSGGVSAVAYSTQDTPYKFPRSPERWSLGSVQRVDRATTSNATWGTFISNGWKLNVPVGAWKVGYEMTVYGSATANVYFNISSDTGIIGDASGTEDIRYTSHISLANERNTIHIANFETPTTAKDFVMYTLGAVTTTNLFASVTKAEIFAEFAYL